MRSSTRNLSQRCEKNRQEIRTLDTGDSSRDIVEPQAQGARGKKSHRSYNSSQSAGKGWKASSQLLRRRPRWIRSPDFFFLVKECKKFLSSSISWRTQFTPAGRRRLMLCATGTCLTWPLRNEVGGIHQNGLLAKDTKRRVTTRSSSVTCTFLNFNLTIKYLHKIWKQVLDARWCA